MIGALEGAEADIAKMRSLMLLLRDCFALPRRGRTALIKPLLMLTVLFNATEGVYSILAHNQIPEEATRLQRKVEPAP